MGRFKENIEEIGFWSWFQKLTFSESYFSTLTSKKTYSSWENFKDGIFNLLIPFMCLFVLWALSGFSTDAEEYIYSIIIFLFLYGVTVILRFFFHKELGVLRNGENIFFFFLTFTLIPAYIFSVYISMEEYNYSFIVALFTAIAPTLIFALMGYYFGGSLILGKDSI